MTKEIENKHEKELNRLYDTLAGLEPGTNEYKAVMDEITCARNGETDLKRLELDRAQAKKEMWFKIGTFIAGMVAVPVIDLVCKRNLTAYIGKIEQMETFTSTPGRSMSSWFRWK